ncbi:MAG: riboflavin synthase [Lentisphaeria bacterium]|nr:riboflavin synthase [Lentisphaeria bacterium]
MFTGLIEDVGILVSMTLTGKAAKLAVRTHLPAAEMAVGDSIAVNGACLTVEELAQDAVHFHALRETLGRTNLSRLAAGASLNLERAVRVGDRLGGHLVSGHVDAMAPVYHAGPDGDDLVLVVGLPAELRELVIMKGSVAINGVSLTVARLEQDRFGVCIIPHTWAHTNLSLLRRGDQVNLEADMIGRYVLRRLEVQAEDRAGKVDLEQLAKAGFL